MVFEVVFQCFQGVRNPQNSGQGLRARRLEGLLRQVPGEAVSFVTGKQGSFLRLMEEESAARGGLSPSVCFRRNALKTPETP